MTQNLCWVGNATLVQAIGGGDSFPLNQWFHAVFLRLNDGLTLQLYVNGVTKFSGVGASQFVVNRTTGAIGRRYPNISNFSWVGNIPIVRFYNRALSPQEITQNYNALKSRFGLT